MKLKNLGSSSAGNCYIVELDRKSGTPVKLMLECGLSYKDIIKKAVSAGEFCIADIDAVLVTHNHQDHSKAAKDLAQRGFKVYGNSYVCGSPATFCEPGKLKVVAADTFVLPFEVEHDAPDSYGYMIRTDAELVVFAADCKFWKLDMSMIAPDYVIIEANYDGRVIHFAIEDAEKKGDSKMIAAYRRLLNAHMSIDNCVKQLKKVDLSRCNGIFLIHLSDRHSNQREFKMKVKKEVGVETYVCLKHGGII